MKNSVRVTILAVVSIFGLSALQSASATPTAQDLLNSCQNSMHLNCTTQHIIYQTTTVYGHGSTPVTNVQTIEIFKKQPGMMKTIMDMGVTKQTVILKGGNYYLLNSNTGTYSVVQAPVQAADPFQEIATDLTLFDSATVQADGSNYVISLSGGKIPNMKAVDHMEVSVDTSTYTISEVKGIGKGGGVVMDVTLQYQQVNGSYQVQTMQTQVNVGAYNIQSNMQVTENEVNTTIADSVFATQ